jgi:hypothetical protein
MTMASLRVPFQFSIKLREARCLVNSFCQNSINWHLCAVFPSLREDMSLDWFKGNMSKAGNHSFEDLKKKQVHL